MASDRADLSTLSALLPTMVRHSQTLGMPLLVLLLILLLLTGLMAGLLSTTLGAQASFRLLEFATAGQIRATNIRGSLAGPLSIGHLSIMSPTQQISLDNIRIRWQPLALRNHVWQIDDISIGDLIIRIPAKSDRKTLRLPTSLSLPLHRALAHSDINRLQILRGDQKLATIEAIRLDWYFEKQVHRINLRSALFRQPDKSSTSLHFRGDVGVQALPGYAIDGNLQLQGKYADMDWGGEIKTNGTLAEMQWRFRLHTGSNPISSPVTGEVWLTPFSAKLFRAGQLSAVQLNLAGLHPDWPQTDLHLHAVLTQDQMIAIALRNTLAGTLDASRLPLTNATGSLRWLGDRITLDDLQINDGVITGRLQQQSGQWAALLNVRQLNLKTIDSRLRTTHLRGQVQLAQGADASDSVDLHLDLSEPLHARALQIRAAATLRSSQLTLTSAKLVLGGGVAEAAGRLSWSGSQAFEIRTRLQRLRLTDLGQWQALPDVVVSGEFRASGQRHPRLRVALHFSVANSRLGQHPFDGHGRLQITDQTLVIQQLKLRAGDNRLQAHGMLTPDHGDLGLRIDAPRLSQLGAALSGELMMAAQVRGSLSQPLVIADWRAQGLRISQRWSVRHAQGHLRYGLTASASLFLQARMQQAVLADLPLTALEIDLQGLINAHQLTVRMRTPVTTIAWSAAGGLEGRSTDATWRGQILQAQVQGKINGSLERSVDLAVSRTDLQIRDLRLSGNWGRLVLDEFRVESDMRIITGRGHAERLHVGRIAGAVGFAPLVRSDLQLYSEWQFSLPWRDHRHARGILTLRRTDGDLRFSGTPASALQLRHLDASAQLNDARLSVRLDAQGEQLGVLQMAGGTYLRRDASSTRLLSSFLNAPIDGVLKAHLPSLSFVGPLLSPGLITAGHLDAELSIAGTLGAPALAGTISAQQLQAHWIDNGLRLTAGRLQAAVHGDLLTLHELSFTGSPDSTGRLSLSGPVRFVDGRPVADLRWQAAEFSVVQRSDRQLVVTGSGIMQTSEGRLRLKGDTVVERGVIDLDREDMPRLSDDVFIVGKPAPTTPVPAIDLDLGIQLGNRLSVRGKGVDARVGGTLRLRSAKGSTFSAKGLIQVTRGTYTAYGRELSIERGVLRFDGAPGNPALDIRAMRRGTPVEPGVMITGTVLAPQIRLVSEPQVPDAEKLSWLVLGQGLNGTTDQQAGMLQQAAASLLTQSAAAGMQSQIAGNLGLDSITLSRRADNVQQRIITLGKRVSSRLYVSYQQGLQAAGSVILLRYTLSPRITMEAETGTRSVFSLFYNFSFD